MNVKLTLHTAQVRKYAAGEILAHKNAPSDKLVILVSGSLGVYESDDVQNADCLTVLGPGDFYGEAGLLLSQPHGGAVAALTDSMALCFDKNDIHELFTKQPAAAFEMMQAICRRSDELCRILSPFSGMFGKEQNRLLIADASHGDKPPKIPPRPPAYVAPPPPPPAPPAPVPMPVSAPTAAPAPAAKPAAVGTELVEGTFRLVNGGPVSSLFPEGHGHYVIPKKPHNMEYLRDKSMTCPLCRHTFKILVPRSSKVMTEHTDVDMRVHYKNIEPMYYEVATCPKCLYSALTDQFDKGFASRAARIRDIMAPYREEIMLKQGEDLDMDTVFAEYYLALLCAQPCFDSYLSLTAMIWLKLTRLYTDCKDVDMAKYAAEKALESYIKVYQNANVSGEKAQRLYISIGECALVCGDMDQARRYFYMAKVEKNATAALKDHADRRLEDTRQE